MSIASSLIVNDWAFQRCQFHEIKDIMSSYQLNCKPVETGDLDYYYNPCVFVALFLISLEVVDCN